MGDQSNPTPGKPFSVPDVTPIVSKVTGNSDGGVPTAGKIEPGSFSPPIGEATVIPYTPGSPANWPSPNPTTVAQALDDLAKGGGDDAQTAATVLGGATYTMLPTDSAVIFDTSNGSRAIAQMVVPAGGWDIGQRFLFDWYNWNISQVGPEVIAPAGILMAPFNGQVTAGSAGLVSSTVITTAGATMVLEWNGTFLAQV
jgi:hypothetical protein